MVSILSIKLRRARKTKKIRIVMNKPTIPLLSEFKATSELNILHHLPITICKKIAIIIATTTNKAKAIATGGMLKPNATSRTPLM